MSDEPGAIDRPEPPPSGPRAGGQEPRFLSTTRGIVTGLTSLVVAMTGLVVACEKLAPADEPAKVARLESNAAGTQSAASDMDTANPEEETVPLLYAGETVRLEWDGDANHWQLTIGDTSEGYEEIASERPEDTMARLVGGNDYLRWPTAGGWLEVSEDGKQSWVRVERIDPQEEPQQ